MKETTIVNTELEQALYTGSQREQKLRSRAMLALFAPLLVGALWLFYSGYQVNALRSRVGTLEDQDAMQAQREKQLQTQTAEAESARAAADAARIAANQAQKASSDQV